jgi:hypothetical protein
MTLARRNFLRLCTAAAAFLTKGAENKAKAAFQYRRPPATRHRKNFVAIQIKPYAWIDEGIDRLLDAVQQKGAVNTIWAYTYDYDEARKTRNGPIPLPDHGVYGADDRFTGGAFFDYDQKYFRNTILKDFRCTDYGKFSVISDVAQKVKARGMDFFAWDYNNYFAIMGRSIPDYLQVSEIDCYGRRTGSPCFNHPDFRAHLSGKIECYLTQYHGEVDGIAWGCERMGPLNNAIGGRWSTAGLSCFCEHCLARAHQRGIAPERARAGYRQLNDLFRAAGREERPTDGYFISFWRLLLQYPEILAWETLWTDSYHQVRSELYGMSKAIAPEKPFGFHVMQNMTLSPFYRAEENYGEIKDYADYLKLATYNNAGGPRMADCIDRLQATVFHDAKAKDFLDFYYRIMNFDEPPYEQLGTGGLSADYVARETRRAIAGVGGAARQVKIYPSIDIDVPTEPKEKRTKPDDVRGSVRAAFEGGADGVVLAREYVEMWFANLSAAGDTIRETFGKRAS